MPGLARIKKVKLFMLNMIDILLKEHERIRSMLMQFEYQLDRFEGAERPDYDILNGSISYCAEYLDKWHHPKEDAVLELLIQRSPEFSESMKELSDQHHALSIITNEITHVFSDISEREGIYLREDLVSRGRHMCSAYRDHLSWEETNFFPIARDLLSKEDLAAVALRFEGVDDPLSSHPVDKRYTVLFAAISEGRLQEGQSRNS